MSNLSNDDPKTGIIGNKVWLDTNGNGIQDEGEVGVAGVSITLTGAGDDGEFGTADDIIATKTTNSNGNYQFTGLAAGDYKVTFGLLDGFGFTTQDAGSDFFDSDADPLTGMTDVIHLTEGKVDRRIDAGLVELSAPDGRIGDRIWFDDDGDGEQEPGESGIVGVTVKLIDKETGEVIATDVTEANGKYLFEGLAEGNYAVMVDTSTLPGNVNQTGDPDVDLDNMSMVALDAGGTDLHQDFGYQRLGAIGDRIWFDNDGDGEQEPGENGITGVTVKLIDKETGDVIATDVTETNGKYLFEGVAQGNYAVMVDTSTLPDNLKQTGDPDADLDNMSMVALDAGETDLHQDFGYQFVDPKTAAIGDRVWLDADGDGVQDDGEAGINGVTVKLINKDTGKQLATDVTEGDGQYLFDGLAAGNYTVMVDTSTLPANLQQTGDPDADLDDMSMEDLNVGETDLHQDFGYQFVDPRTAAIGDRVWLDADGDGVQDDGEAGINGVTVKLINKDTGEQLATDVTEGDGQYLFDGLAAGNYTVMVDTSTLPANLVQTGDPDADLDDMSMEDLNVGETDLEQDFGYRKLTPSIDIEKFTNGVDADTPDAAVQIAAGDHVVWTYKVTNDGEVAFNRDDIVVTDDQEGTISNIVNQGDGDDILSPGEMWVYQQQGRAQNLIQKGSKHRIYLTGHSYLDGPDGNIRQFSSGDVSVKTSAFARNKYGQWHKAFLGAFSGGLGVTDYSEGSGRNGLHRVDNVYNDNYVLFEFNKDVIVDDALLYSVSGDSDITYWVGSKDDPFNNHNHLSDRFLDSLDVREASNNGGHYNRWADINNGEVVGNILVIAASTLDHTPDDRFKIKAIDVHKVDSGIYRNVGTVDALDVSDSDLSHYSNLGSSHH